MYWIYQTRFFTRRNKPLVANLFDPQPGLLIEWFKDAGIRSPLQDEPYGLDLHFTFQIDRRPPHPDNYLASDGFKLYSQRLEKLMQSFDVQAEYFPAGLVDQDGKPISGLNYSIFHLLEGVLPAMDELKSHWTGDRQVGIPTLVLDYARFPQRPIFLCDLLYLPLMRDDLKQALQQQGITGFEFLSPEKYRSGQYGALLEFKK